MEVDAAVTWYDVNFAEDGLSQGELIFACILLEPVIPDQISENALEIDADLITGNFIILSQSCDLEQDNIDAVVLAPVYSVGQFVGADPNLHHKAIQCAHSKKINIPADESLPADLFMRLAQECKSLRSEIDTIRRGDKPAYHLLNEEPTADLPFSIVDFHRIYSAPKKYLLELIKRQGPRIRLKPPYREHLSQAFARYFMRVGLPSDIRQFAG